MNEMYEKYWSFIFTSLSCLSRSHSSSKVIEHTAMLQKQVHLDSDGLSKSKILKHDTLRQTLPGFSSPTIGLILYSSFV